MKYRLRRIKTDTEIMKNNTGLKLGSCSSGKSFATFKERYVIQDDLLKEYIRSGKLFLSVLKACSSIP